MFIERSVAKIRLVRTLFVLLAVVPCATLVGVAAYRHSPAARDRLEQDVQRLLGLPVALDDVRYLRPGALRCGRCRLRSAGASVEVTVHDVEVETSSDELRLRIPELVCGPATAGLLGGIARAWLTEPVRFTRNWVVDIGSVVWSDAEGPAAAAGRRRAVRIECVAAGESRAVRIVRSVGGDASADEIRVIVHASMRSGAPGTAEVHASLSEPVPWSILQPLVASPSVAGLSFGDAALISGTCQATALASGWAGTGMARIDDVDLNRLGGSRVTGRAVIDVDRLEWGDGRVQLLEARLATGRGRIDQPLLDALVGVAGCRPGPAYRSLGGEPVRPFDDMAFTVAVDEEGLRVRAVAGRDGAMIRLQGLSLIDEPAATIPFDRLAWLLSPTPGPAIPAAPGAAWLMTVMPPSPAARPAGDRPPPRTGASGQRTDF